MAQRSMEGPVVFDTGVLVRAPKEAVAAILVALSGVSENKTLRFLFFFLITPISLVDFSPIPRMS